MQGPPERTAGDTAGASGRSPTRQGHPQPSAPPWLAPAATAAWRFVGIAAALAVAVWLASQLSVIVISTMVAFIITAVFAPVVRWLTSHRLSRTAASLLVTLAALLVLFGVLTAIGFRVAEQIPQLADQLSQGIQQLSRYIPGLSEGGGNLVDRATQVLQSTGGSGGGSEQILSAVQAVGRFVGGFFLMVVLVFFFLRDGERMWGWLLGLMRSTVRDDVDATGRAMWATVGGYIRALAIIAATDALGIGIGLVLLGVPLVATLVTLTFLGSFVPVVGAFLAGTAAVLVAFVSGGLTSGLIALGIVVAVQQFDNNVLEPWIMGSRLPLHPVLIVVAVAVGSVVAGIAGAFLAVPIAAAASAGGHVLRMRHGEVAVRGSS